MKPIEAFYNRRGERAVAVEKVPGYDQIDKQSVRCLILPGLTAADWNALMELVRAAGDAVTAAGDVVNSKNDDEMRRGLAAFKNAEKLMAIALANLPPAIIAAAREGK